MIRILALYFSSWWLPALVYICLLGGYTITAITRWKPLALVSNVFFYVVGLAFLGIIVASIWNLIKKRWGKGISMSYYHSAVVRLPFSLMAA
jgi:hypothetical protein